MRGRARQARAVCVRRPRRRDPASFAAAVNCGHLVTRPPTSLIGLTSIGTPEPRRNGASVASDHGGGSFDGWAFVGHSFSSDDKRVAECVIQTLGAVGVSVITGERPKADRISEKVKKLVEEQPLFVGVFTRRDKIARKTEWITTSWVVDEGVGSIGGIQGDYEFIEFNRDRLEE